MPTEPTETFAEALQKKLLDASLQLQWQKEPPSAKAIIDFLVKAISEIAQARGFEHTTGELYVLGRFINSGFATAYDETFTVEMRHAVLGSLCMGLRGLGICLVCGCDDEHACARPKLIVTDVEDLEQETCHWHDANMMLCSFCAEKQAAEAQNTHEVPR